jgi:cytoskeletal protein CcmA (bactofilin family)
MWNKRRDEEPQRSNTPHAPAPVQAVASPSPVVIKKEATPVSSMSPARFDPENRGGPATSGGSATIGKAVKIVGQIYSNEDLYVDGEVEGTVEAMEHKLTIGPNGTVKATVKAREVAVLGSIAGNVEATDKIEIRKDAKLVGDIKTARIIIEDGAYFKGSIDIVKPEPVKAAPKPAQQAAGAPHANQASAAAGATEIKR